MNGIVLLTNTNCHATRACETNDGLFIRFFVVVVGGEKSRRNRVEKNVCKKREMVTRKMGGTTVGTSDK